MKYLLALLLFVTAAGYSTAQNAPFQILLEPVEIPGVGGLQAFAFGRHDGKWLILGGRLDGLHRRQPFASFDIAGHNNLIWVIDPVAGQSWSAPVTSLPVSVQEQMRATNMQFVQTGDYLYIAGGYGYSETAGDHITYDKLTAVDVPAVMHAIINGLPFQGFFRQVADGRFAVTGGHMVTLYGTYYVVGGQYFEGRYNPMGPTHGPGFVQQYTNQIRKFSLVDDGVNLQITHFPPQTDSVNLHRRDYNVAPQILPNGQEGATAFSGVFQTTVDLPYLNCVNIDSGGYAVNNAFSQYYNHYHCPFLPLYDAQANAMHTVFFGGIAQFYDSLGILVQDNNVPFVRTIARVTRTADGTMAEYKLPVDMPALLGASAEFIPAEGLPEYPNGVVKLHELSADTTMAGYIYGGIASSAPNIFWINTGVESSASNQIFKVYVVKNTATAVHQLNAQSRSSLRMQVFPNPNNGVFGVKFYLDKPGKAYLTIADTQGVIVNRELLENLRTGENIVTRRLDNVQVGKTYLVTLQTETDQATVKTIIQE